MLAAAKHIGAAVALSGLGGAGVSLKLTALTLNNFSTSVNPNGDNSNLKLSLPSFASAAFSSSSKG